MFKIFFSALVLFLISTSYSSETNPLEFLGDSYDPVIATDESSSTSGPTITALDIKSGFNDASFDILKKNVYLKVDSSKKSDQILIFYNKVTDKYTFTVSETNKNEGFEESDFNDNKDLQRDEYNAYLPKSENNKSYLIKLTLDEKSQTTITKIILIDVIFDVNVSDDLDKLNNYPDLNQTVAFKIKDIKSYIKNSLNLLAYVKAPKNVSCGYFLNGFKPQSTSDKKSMFNAKTITKRSLLEETLTDNFTKINLNEKMLKDSDVLYYYCNKDSSKDSSKITSVSAQFVKTDVKFSINNNFYRSFSLKKDEQIYYEINNNSNNRIFYPRLTAGKVNFYAIEKDDLNIGSLGAYINEFKNEKEIDYYISKHDNNKVVLKVVALENTSGFLDMKNLEKEEKKVDKTFYSGNEAPENIKYYELIKKETKGSFSSKKFKQIFNLIKANENSVNVKVNNNNAEKLEENKPIIADLEEKVDYTFELENDIKETRAIVSAISEESNNIEKLYISEDALKDHKKKPYEIKTDDNKNIIRVFDVKEGSHVTNVQFEVISGDLKSVKFRIVPESYKNGNDLYANTVLSEDYVVPTDLNYVNVPVYQTNVKSLAIFELEFKDAGSVNLYYSSCAIFKSGLLLVGLFVIGLLL